MSLSSSQKVSARSFVLKLEFNDGVTNVKIDEFVHSFYEIKRLFTANICLVEHTIVPTF